METASDQSRELPPESQAASTLEPRTAAPSGEAASRVAAAATPAEEEDEEQATLVDGQQVAPLGAQHRQRITSPAAHLATPPDAATYQDFAPSPAHQWQPPRPGPQAGPAARPQSPANVPWRAAQTWGATTLSADANTAAGASYLLWWLSGVLIYFNERNNRYVRFHAMQAILLTSALTVLGVLSYILAALCHDLGRVTRWTVFTAFGNGLTLLTVIFIVVIWLVAMVGAWTGNYLHWPIVGAYAERYAAPPIMLTPNPMDVAGQKQS